MSDNVPFVSIVIPLFNEEQYVADCISALKILDYPRDRYEIIAVDNGSTDRSCDIVRELDVALFSLPDVKVGEVRNFGVAQSRGEIVVFIDSDCVAYKEWLRDGVKQLENFDAVGGLVMLRDKPSWIERNWILKSSRDYQYQNTFSGACIFIKRNVFDEIGGFDIHLNSAEDSALTETLRNNGYKIAINPKLNVVHLGYPVTIKDFINRQKWHSADYAKQLNSLIKDKTMLLVLMFLMSLIMLMVGLVLMHTMLITLSLVSLVLIPLVFSVKRVLRYKGISAGSDIFSVYLVDVFYVVGRMLGLISGLKRLASSSANDKIGK